jgi:hypothetical protein
MALDAPADVRALSAGTTQVVIVALRAPVLTTRKSLFG